MRETALDAKIIATTVKLEVLKKVIKKYKVEGDTSNSRAYARALEDATREVALTAEDYEDIAKQMKANRAKRMANRENRTKFENN